MIGAIFSVLGFLANILIIIVLYVFITNFLSTFIFKIFKKILYAYVSIRTYYYKKMSEKNPKDKVIADKYRRSVLQDSLLFMQDQLAFLTDKYGSFEICPSCNFPTPPDAFTCKYCGHIPKNKLTTVCNAIRGNEHV